MSVTTDSYLTLSQFNSLVASLVQIDATSDIWVTAEISDFNVRGGHCYLELVEKDDRAATVARARAIIWANNFYRIRAAFERETGQALQAGIKIMALVSASFHPAYGYSLLISDINPQFTVGQMVLQRRLIIERLTAEGVIDMNRDLPWPVPANRIAVISAPGAAGYGDFLSQLLGGGRGLRFYVDFFPAVMQGQRAPSSIIAALDMISQNIDRYDCAVIIRGGGATDDLACFEDYELAANIAQFPLPVIIGIGHERDITLLDYVANMRVKTPTAAAEWLLMRQENLLGELDRLSESIVGAAAAAVMGSRVFIDRVAALLPSAARNAIDRSREAITRSTLGLSSAVNRRIKPEATRLDIMAEKLKSASTGAITRNRAMIDSIDNLVTALSPEAVLKRGYTITRRGGTTVKNAKSISRGDTIETVFYDGTVTSKITDTKPSDKNNNESTR